MKIEASRSAFSSCSDRFVKKYRDAIPFEEQCKILSETKGVYALPVTYSRDEDPIKIKQILNDHGLRAGTIVPDTYSDTRCIGGTLSCRDKHVRREMTQVFAEAMDFCSEIDGVDVMLWLGHDGYDYPFEDDYSKRWGWLCESLYKVVSHRSDVNVAIEYKPADPRIFQYISSAAKSLVLCSEVGLSNLGVILDYGHALAAGETPAESAALLARYDRLFHVHLSDNYSKMDDDMMIGSVSLWQTLDFFYQLQMVGYDGWYVMDIWAPRLDGRVATNSFVKRANGLWEIAKALPREKLWQLQEDNDVSGIYDLIGNLVLDI